MSCVDKYRALKNKNGGQITKELTRRGMTCGDCRTTDEIICKIVAYDAYHAGRSEGLEEARKGCKDTVKTTAKERSGIVLKDNANDTFVFLKVTEDQKNLLDYLIDHDWLTDVSFSETEQIEWDEP